MVYQKVTLQGWIVAPAFFNAVLVACLLMLSSCVAVDNAKIFSQNAIASARTQGEHLVRTPEKTREQYACALHRKSMLHLEEVQVLPEVVAPGKEINQRMRYALCPSTPASSVQGRITRTVLFQGKALFRDVTNYEFKPGTWRVDVFIGIPKEAIHGIYRLDIAVRYDNKTLHERKEFVVKSQ